MSIFLKQKSALLHEIDKLHKRNELSKNVGPDYYEPGLMEYLSQSDGYYDEESGELVIRFEARGTRYDDRTEQIEKIALGDVIRVVREKSNAYNSNNCLLLTEDGHNIGNMPAELCSVIAPLYDAGNLDLDPAHVSFVEPISKRSRYAKQAILFVELKARLHDEDEITIDWSKTPLYVDDPLDIRCDLSSAVAQEMRDQLISEFYGIKIDMNYTFCVPAIHATYAKSSIVINMDGGICEISNGFPRDKIVLLKKWIKIHRDEIIDNHLRCGRHQFPLKEIAPL